MSSPLMTGAGAGLILRLRLFFPISRLVASTSRVVFLMAKFRVPDPRTTRVVREISPRETSHEPDEVSWAL